MRAVLTSSKATSSPVCLATEPLVAHAAVGGKKHITQSLSLRTYGHPYSSIQRNACHAPANQDTQKCGQGMVLTQ